jgi:alpha-glucosidase (family GH31 glycosyl hydrolase)
MGLSRFYSSFVEKYGVVVRWSHDIGGNHNGGYSGYEPVPGTVPKLYPGDENPNNSTGSEMLLRWLQFGTFSPILR